MARMFPPDIEEHGRATPGESLFFRFVRDTAVPHDDYTCWYEPAVGKDGAAPDFNQPAIPAAILDSLDEELDKFTKGKEPGKVRIILD